MVAVVGLAACKQGTGAPIPNEATEPLNEGGWVTGDDDPRIPDNEISSFERAARHGDNSAAHGLAQHYRALRRSVEETRWLRLAAHRGDCAALGRLRELAEDEGNLADATNWNSRLRQGECTWAKAYGSIGNDAADSMPLWHN